MLDDFSGHDRSIPTKKMVDCSSMPRGIIVDVKLLVTDNDCSYAEWVEACFMFCAIPPIVIFVLVTNIELHSNKISFTNMCLGMQCRNAASNESFLMGHGSTLHSCKHVERLLQQFKFPLCIWPEDVINGAHAINSLRLTGLVQLRFVFSPAKHG